MPGFAALPIQKRRFADQRSSNKSRAIIGTWSFAPATLVADYSANNDFLRHSENQSYVNKDGVAKFVKLEMSEAVHTMQFRLDTLRSCTNSKTCNAASIFVQFGTANCAVHTEFQKVSS